MPYFQAIRELMTPAPRVIDQDATLLEADEQMKSLGVQHLPVVSGDRLVGLLSARDILLSRALLGSGHQGAAVRLVMSAPVFTCGPEAQLYAVAAQMLGRRCGSAVIVARDQPTRVLGIFTMTDMLRLLSVPSDSEARSGARTG